jgi:hypothetical protein
MTRGWHIPFLDTECTTITDRSNTGQAAFGIDQKIAAAYDHLMLGKAFYHRII